jgi:hypothetical protein
MEIRPSCETQSADIKSGIDARAILGPLSAFILIAFRRFC